MDPDITTPETRDADERDATAAHRADRPPTPEEERLADGNDVEPSVGEAYREMAKLGAEVDGEGRIG